MSRSKEDKRAIALELEGFRFDTPYGKEVGRFVRHGIGIHHGGLLPKYRRLVERVAQRGLLKVISGTDTLGVGVNIPIRTVLFTRLYKFDGSGSKILGVRDFLQIAGRAGRKGFDELGTVVALAPEHVADNLLLEEKAKADPSKKKKLVRRKPPTKGYVHWDRGTFDKLVGGTPEPLVSRFEVSHAMLVNVLSRHQGGCTAMKALIRRCHDRPAQQRLHGRRAIQLMRGLLRSRVVEIVERQDGQPPAVRINADLQQGFSLNHALSLYLVETLALLDPERDHYALDVLSLVEAILENPDFLLDRQLDRIKRERLAELKAEGVEYDDRMEELAKLEYPKPNREFIYATFDDFALRHPWVGPECIRPKGVARELYEQYHGFSEAVREYAIERSEGLLLRYMADVYRTLIQNVPESAWNEAVDDLIAYVHGFVRGVDSSLLDEWEQLRDPDYLPRRLAAPEAAAPERPPTLSTDLRAFTVLVRNHVFMLVRALARRQYEAAAELVVAPPDERAWTGKALERAFEPYYEDHSAIRFDAAARGTQYTLVDRGDERLWRVTQKLADPEGYDDWSLGMRVDLDRADEAGAPVVELERIG